MKSGDPKPNDDLRHVIAAKLEGPGQTVEIVSEAARWLKGALKGADVHFSYGTCEERDAFGFAAFTIVRSYQGVPTTLSLKIAEIRDTPFIFAEVHTHGSAAARASVRSEETLFPFFGDLRSEENRDFLLHYIADFVVSTRA